MIPADTIGPESPPAPKKERRFAREMTAAVGLPVLIWIVGWTPPLIFAAFVGLAALAGLWEFLLMGENKGLPMQKLLSTTLLLILLASVPMTTISAEVAIFVVLLAIPMAYVFSNSRLEDALPASAVCILGILYIGLLSGALMRMRLDFPRYGSDLVFFLLIVVWSGDTLAYYTGKNFGRTKLLPRVSPKKTVEGLAGGVAGSLIGATAIHFTFFPEFPLIHALICAAVLSLAGVVGDLAESAWKRSAAVKDSGTLIPGHGGILDRTDSILFTAPILYAYWFVLHEPLF